MVEEKLALCSIQQNCGAVTYRRMQVNCYVTATSTACQNGFPQKAELIVESKSAKSFLVLIIFVCNTC